MLERQSVDLTIGMELFTRDGRKVGNSRIMSEEQHPVRRQAVFGITTEQGSSMILTEPQIDALFYRSRQ
ncbi:hypothetical protein [Noviherbaspirillum pedocola]|uniref:Uncharacterized protein n=1 Tax=Noviherbaspirillum pedocola TaxID=2801341 RepID=A0A934SWI8_9BURK|nr:hypothetical protein [Noviherbaspirillum pedocola]MBK4737880.1 hypothetical protein [Noviherbaspirillum pedocola]